MSIVLHYDMTLKPGGVIYDWMPEVSGKTI